VTNASLATTAESRYAHIFAPPPPGKRPEQQQFDLSLLFSDKEYCIEEARARSIGLYGKKWPAPPPPAPFSPLGNSAVSSSSSSSLSSVKVNFNDDGQGSSRMGAGRRRSLLGGAEPTVTINTKEALADVFGMFNSPEKTAKLAAMTKKIEPVTPIAPPPPRKPGNENENSYAKTPQSG
jgi:checkpoint serine/threonine-protein kinase